MKMINVPLVNGLGKTKGVEEAGNKVWKGDLEKIDFGEKDLIEINDLIYNKSFKEFGAGKVCFLGGDHSMSYPITRAFFDWCENESKKPCLIVFDAHPDLMEPVDRKIPTHEEWLRGLVEDGFPVENILLAAADKGLATCWIAIPKPGKLSSDLDVPDNVEIQGAIAIGYARKKVKAPSRLDAGDLVSFEAWGAVGADYNTSLRGEQAKPLLEKRAIKKIRDRIKKK